MPTGYTYKIMEKDFDLKKWLIEEIPRNFGLLMSFRDDGKLTEKQILKQLEDDTNNDYHLKEMKKAQKNLIELKKKSDKQLKKEMDRFNQEEANDVKQQIKDNEKGKKKFNEIKQKLLELKSNADEFAGKVLDFGIDQINQTVEHDFNYVSTLTQHTDIDKYRKSLLKDIQRDIKYHQEEYTKSCDRKKERLEIYKQYSKFIKDNLTAIGG